MNKGVFLLLGTNMGDRNKNLITALNAIDPTVGTIKKKSAVYETAAWGKTDQQRFYNQVIEIETPLSSPILMEEILAIEQKMGRQRIEKWGERIIDIDILFFGQETIETAGLIIPHPQLANRRFTLVPLNEIAPNLMHPKLQKKIKALLKDCPDQLEVIRISDSMS